MLLPARTRPPANTMNPFPLSSILSSLSAAGIFNIIATLIDGTALSLPYAIAKCGLVVGIGVVLLAYQTTLLSCRLIVVLSRKVHAASISGIVDQILGSTWRQIFSWNLALVLLCILIGFMILGTTTLPSAPFTTT